MRKLTGLTAERLESLCGSWPGVTRDIKWGDERVYSVAGKMFALTRDQPGPLPRLFVKVEAERFLELTDQPGIRPAPYLARHHWVMLEPLQRLATDELERLVRRSYGLVRAKLPKKTQAALGAVPEADAP